MATEVTNVDLPICILDLPSELIKIIVKFMNGQSWIKFDRTNNYYHNILSNNERKLKYKEANKEKYDKYNNIVVIDGLNYYTSKKQIQPFMRKKRKYKDAHYIFCNNCAAELNSNNLAKHLQMNCHTNNKLICSKCSVVDPKHYDCNYDLQKCNYCNENFYKYEINFHIKECSNTEIPCKCCHEKIKLQDIEQHTNYYCSEIKTCCKFCGQSYKQRNHIDKTQHTNICTVVCPYCKNNFRIKDYDSHYNTCMLICMYCNAFYLSKDKSKHYYPNKNSMNN